MKNSAKTFRLSLTKSASSVRLSLPAAGKFYQVTIATSLFLAKTLRVSNLHLKRAT